MTYVDWRAGQRITAGQLRAITPGPWEPWTPTWTTTSGAATPSFGDAVVDGLYVHFGKLCHGRLLIAFGSTTSFGGGGTGDNWQFSLPTPAAAVSTHVGMGEIAQSIGSRLAVRVRLQDTGQMVLETASGRVDATALTSPNWGVVDAVTPWTWSSGNTIRIDFAYETAT